MVMVNMKANLSSNAASGSDITPCIKIDKPPVKRAHNNVAFIHIKAITNYFNAHDKQNLSFVFLYY